MIKFGNETGLRSIHSAVVAETGNISPFTRLCKFAKGSMFIQNRPYMHPFIPYLEKRLSHTLPGQKAQLKMAPSPVSKGPARKMKAPDHATRSGVLILLFPNRSGALELILTLRSRHIDHGGQISFPGGRSEAGETAEETALRETREEVGVTAGDIQILGNLTNLYVSHSNNYVTPVVGVTGARPEMKINPDEVEEVLAVELDSLATKKNLATEQWNLKEHSYEVPFWDIHRVPLWGATAMMLNELLELYREWKGVSHD